MVDHLQLGHGQAPVIEKQHATLGGVEMCVPTHRPKSGRNTAQVCLPAAQGVDPVASEMNRCSWVWDYLVNMLHFRFAKLVFLTRVKPKQETQLGRSTTLSAKGISYTGNLIYSMCRRRIALYV